MTGRLGFELLPAVDLRDGRVVRLTRGDDARRTVYGEDPAAVLERYRRAGVSRAHVVDLDAALGHPPQRALLERLAGLDPSVRPGLQLGGGLRDADAVAWALEAGFDRVVLGSLVTRDFDRFAELTRRHPGRLVPALDCAGGEVRVAGWTERAPLTLGDLCEGLRDLPCPAVLVTDIDRDGTLEGPNLELARRVGAASGLPALLSGGVRSAADLVAAREIPEVGGAVVGKALYEGLLTLERALAVARGEESPSKPATGLACRVIPCLDVSSGRVVKGVRFQNFTDQGDPAEAALRYAEQGADEIVFLDITAAPERRGTDLDWVRRTAEQVFVPLTVGGGVRSVEDARELLKAGADKVGINTAAVARPELLRELAETFGSQCVVLSVDGRRRPETQGGVGEAEPGGWEVVTHGGRTGTGLDLLGWVRRGVELGAGEILLTSIDSDGTRGGYDLEQIRAVAEAVPVPVIASGGAGTPQHLTAALAAGASAVLAASIFHHGTYTVAEVKDRLAEAGFPVRREHEPEPGPEPRRKEASP